MADPDDQKRVKKRWLVASEKSQSREVTRSQFFLCMVNLLSLPLMGFENPLRGSLRRVRASEDAGAR